jgi:hypothetical protein
MKGERDVLKYMKECLDTECYLSGLFIGLSKPMINDREYIQLMGCMLDRGMREGKESLEENLAITQPMLREAKPTLREKVVKTQDTQGTQGTHEIQSKQNLEFLKSKALPDKHSLLKVSDTFPNINQPLQTKPSTSLTLEQPKKPEQVIPQTTKHIKVKLICSWTSCESIVKLWNKMSMGNFTWNSIKLVWGESEVADYYVIINAPPPNVFYEKEKTIIFRMEPEMSKNPYWGEWAEPKDEKQFLKVFKHENGDYNNVEWHISKTYTNLMESLSLPPITKTKCISAILSEKYSDSGHIKRVDFVKYTDVHPELGYTIDVYGSNRWEYKNYIESLPYHCKDKGLFPYKYTFNAENKNVPGYFTEKLIDGILAECLVFYSGCYDVKEYIDERAFVFLNLSSYENDAKIIKRAIEEDWHTQRLPYIREAKRKILEELQFFPRLEKFIKSVGGLSPTLREEGKEKKV